MPSSSQQHRSTHQRPQEASRGPTSIPDNRLGLDPEDIETLRRHQQLAHDQARRSAGSQASSQGRLLLDPGSLQLLSRHFDRIMGAISQRLEQLNRATEIATQVQYDRAGNEIEMADAEIRRFQGILQQIEELDTEFDKIKHLREIVRSFRARVEQMERRLG